MVSDHHFLRAYNAGYLKFLRQSVLSGLPAHSVAWILEKAETSVLTGGFAFC